MCCGGPSWKDPGDIRKKEILESRNRYIDEQFKLDDDDDLDEVDSGVKGTKLMLLGYEPL